jgi:hypothetical protein
MMQSFLVFIVALSNSLPMLEYRLLIIIKASSWRLFIVFILSLVFIFMNLSANGSKFTSC